MTTVPRKNDESDIYESEFSDSESDETSSGSSSGKIDFNECPQSKTHSKAKMICQFFFSSIEGDFSWPVASFPVRQMNCQKTQSVSLEGNQSPFTENHKW